MAKKGGDGDRYVKWARFRFAIVAHLLASPPASGGLSLEIRCLAEKTWTHPMTGLPVKFAFSTIERWYYQAKGSPQDPVGALRRKVRKDQGEQPSISLLLRMEIRAQYKAHKSWSYKLHHDNLEVLCDEGPTLGRMPSYSTIRRFMKSQGLHRRRRRTKRTPGAIRAEERLEAREVRSFEVPYVHGLWHYDFHTGSLKVLTEKGVWETPHLLAVLDDRSRWCCHAQWYLSETAEVLVHGLSQAFLKAGLPREDLADNGSAMVAGETQEGLLELGIQHTSTLPESPYQNGKQEVFWAQAEGRLVSMLEGVQDLTLRLLNIATLAWVDQEYNRKRHEGIGVPPIERYLKDPDVGRESPSPERLRQAFRLKEQRTQRRSDGTVSIEGQRFEIPSRYRHLTRVWVRYARWDLSYVHLWDPRTARLLCRIYPVDKEANANGLRRPLSPITPDGESAQPAEGGIAPLLRKYLADYAATGLPPAYLPKHDYGPEDPEKEETL